MTAPATTTDDSRRISVRYRIRPTAGPLDAATVDAFAQALALEQSVEVPHAAVRDPWVAENIVGRVEAVVPAADGSFEVTLRLAVATTGFDVAQTINMLFGNASLHPGVTLVDADIPPGLVARFPRPRFGIAGLRERTGARGRALTCAALKPQGLAPDALADIFRTFAEAGIDVVKDDHGLADQAYAPFAERVRACRRVAETVRRATGRAPLYAPSLVGGPRTLATHARIARDEGCEMVLIAPALVGMPVFAELVETLGVPVLAHPAYAGAARVETPFLLGSLFRLLGADATIYPNHGGRFALPPATCAAIAAAARAPRDDVPPILPVPAGGLTVERVPELLDFYGDDVMLLIGGSLLAAADPAARTREFVRRVHAGAAT